MKKIIAIVLVTNCTIIGAADSMLHLVKKPHCIKFTHFFDAKQGLLTESDGEVKKDLLLTWQTENDRGIPTYQLTFPNNIMIQLHNFPTIHHIKDFQFEISVTLTTPYLKRISPENLLATFILNAIKISLAKNYSTLKRFKMPPQALLLKAARLIAKDFTAQPC